MGLIAQSLRLNKASTAQEQSLPNSFDRSDVEEALRLKSFDYRTMNLLLYVMRGWVAVKELKLSHHIWETLLCTIYTHYGNLI